LPKMETPQIDFKDIIDLLSEIKLDSNSIEADLSSVFEFIGIVGINFSLEDSALGLEIKNDFVQMNSSITPIEYKEIEVPTEYFDEADLLNVIDYAEDIMTMINQQHGYISFNGKYEAIEVSGNIYVDWMDTLKAKGTVQVVYEGQVLTLDLIYTNETVYVAYENIKVKISEVTIKELIQDKLPALPESKPEGILTKVLEVVKELSIADDKISVLLNLGVFLERMSEIELVFTDTLAGFDITTNLYDLNLSLDVTKTEEIEVKDSEYSTIEGYIDLVEYILSIINKESLGVHIDGTYYLESMPITFTGNLELMYNSNTSTYEVFMDLIVVVFDITAQVQLTYVEEKLYIQFYDTVIEISTSDFEEIISVVCEKFNLSLEKADSSLPIDTLIDLTKAIHLLDHSIELDLSQFVSLFTNLVISYTKLDSGY
ncbi:MAG: hypothetical protein K2M84_05605, partial [Anaeroplasmataceae bacterium]|nr:hypothetical protein [Anaeroplasmataceae bacterium]